MHHYPSRPINPALSRAISTALPSVPHIQSPAPHSATKTHAAPQSQPRFCKTNPPQVPKRPAKPLNPNQLTAARLLLAGHSVTAVAATLGVDPYTISRWKKDPRFQSELRRQIHLQSNPPPTRTAPPGATPRHNFYPPVQNQPTARPDPTFSSHRLLPPPSTVPNYRTNPTKCAKSP